ncbi:MAG: flagellar hook-length control protein FliK [Phycisphaerales bacterium]
MTQIDGVNDAARSLRESREDRVRDTSEGPREASGEAQTATSGQEPSFRERLDARKHEGGAAPEQPTEDARTIGREPAPPQILRVAQDMLVGDDVTVAHRYEASTETGAVTRDLAPTHHTAAAASAAVIEGGAAQTAPSPSQTALGHEAMTSDTTRNAALPRPRNAAAGPGADAQSTPPTAAEAGDRVESTHLKATPRSVAATGERNAVEPTPVQTVGRGTQIVAPAELSRAAGGVATIDAEAVSQDASRLKNAVPAPAQEAPIGRAPSTLHSPVAAASMQDASGRSARSESGHRERDDRSRRESSPVGRADSAAEGVRREAASHPAFELRMEPSMDDLRPQPANVTKMDAATGAGSAQADPLLGEPEGPVARAAARGLAAALRQQGGTVSLRLQPESLGDLRVRMTIDAGRVSVEMSASTDEARDAIETSLDALKRSLESRGLEVNRMDVGVHRPAPEQDDRAKARESSRREDPFGRPTRRSESVGESLLRLAVNMVG